MDERVTIKELARVSGVSVGTVSRALNGYADVRPETRERIMRLARELDYTPAAAARSLVTQRSHIIGVFMETGEGHPDLQHPFFHEVLGGLKQRVGAEGFDLLLFASERPGNGYGPHSYLKRARHHNVDGCALIGLDPDDAEVRRLARAEIPCVGIDMDLEGDVVEVVMSDNEGGAIAAVRHLHDLGHRRIATITGMVDSRPGADRLRGYRAAVQALGPRLPRRLRGLRRLLRREREGGHRAPAGSGRAPDRDLRRRRHDGHRRHPRGRRGRPQRARGPLDRRFRRHPARLALQPAPHHDAPGQARPGRRRRRRPRRARRRRP